jgi:hypothetical protein
VRPSAISASTSRSRGVSSSSGSARRRRSSSAATSCGSTTTPPADDARDRVRQLVDVEDAVLEQVPDPLLIAVEEPERILGLDVLREHEKADVVEARPDLRGGSQALVGERRRKTDVDEDGVGPLALDDVEQLGRGLGLPDELEPRAAEEAPQALADEQRVFGDGEPQRH